MDRFELTPGESESVVIELAQEDDLPTILRLLATSGLPEAGLAEYLDTTLVARKERSLIGSAGLELYGTYALLRSVTVAEAFRSCGIGHRLVESVLQMARQKRVTQVFLLTETAEAFFPRFGFQTIERALVPSPVQNSVEFASACPESALAMALSFPSVLLPVAQPPAVHS